jgi:hypothetical protein
MWKRKEGEEAGTGDMTRELIVCMTHLESGVGCEFKLRLGSNVGVGVHVEKIY